MSNYVFFWYSVSHVFVVIPFRSVYVVLCCVVLCFDFVSFFCFFLFWNIGCDRFFQSVVTILSTDLWRPSRIKFPWQKRQRLEMRWVIYIHTYIRYCIIQNEQMTKTNLINHDGSHDCFIFSPFSETILFPLQQTYYYYTWILKMEQIESWKHVHTRRFNKWTKSAKNRRMN